MSNLFFVEMQIEVPASASSDINAFVATSIRPSFESLLADKRVVEGGMEIGAKNALFMLRANSHNEVDQFLMSLSWWPLCKSIRVIALQDLQTRYENDKILFGAGK
eukprot:TRINITY_DN5521_c0_g1_i5.p2 TRINITY_DN5521_c0_g1~~TRINITY_DN5521_c0_g1_i5.p2  ORF type:complete len:106 (-),score=21.64 TRINITY_DN5521_c0_g1_i5:667-984(-)